MNAEELELNQFFLSLSLEEKRVVLLHPYNKRRLTPFRNLIKCIALATGNLADYTRLRNSCRHFRKWLPPPDSGEVSAKILYPQVLMFREALIQRILGWSIKPEVSFYRLNCYGSGIFRHEYRIDRRTGFIRYGQGSYIFGSVFDDDFSEMIGHKGEPRKFSRNSKHEMHKRQVELNRKKKKLKV
jgi:hypothetical protein